MAGLLLRYEVKGEERSVRLEGEQVRIGRGGDNDVVLPDHSVSRRHAVVRPVDGDWVIQDLGSTNGLVINRSTVQREQLRVGDRLRIGAFELLVAAAEDDTSAAALQSEAIQNATFVRPLTEFSNALGLDAGIEGRTSPEAIDAKTSSPEGLRYFKLLNRLARDLIHADTTDEVLTRVLDIAFEALPVDRGFILLGDATESSVCEVARIGDEVTLRPDGNVPVSSTILRTVLEREVALLTLDARDDLRLSGGESIRIHGIRAAMCAPLWSSKQISGFIQVDTPFQAGSFSEEHLDFLITIANYAAVGVQRLQERRMRHRFERYHSPAVIEEMMRQELGTSLAGYRDLRKTSVTVLFADLVGFTAYSETASLDDVAELLSGYCSRAVEAIFEQGGTLDKYIGDCVMAFFGAPIECEDHALRAVRAAVQVLDALDVWNADRSVSGLPAVRCRVALNSGPVMVGDIGSAQRVDYTVLGNAVNVAARLEAAVAEPGQIVVGAATRDLLPDGVFRLSPLGTHHLRGLQQPVEAYRVLRDNEALPPRPLVQTERL
jgi:adenylate cyclase